MTVPIVPGPTPEEPTEWQQPQQHQPQPIYYARPSDPVEVVKKSAIGTVTVIVTLVALCCVLPMVLCVVLSVLGSTTDAYR